MSSVQPASESSRSPLKIILGVLIALAIVCVLVPFFICVILTLLGPQISNVFSRITYGMGG